MECNCLHLPLIPASYTTGIKGSDKQLHSTVTVECNCLHLPLIPASYTTGIKGSDKQLHSTVSVECNCLHLPLIPDSYTTGIKGRDKQLHSTVSVECNCLHLPLIPDSYTTGIKGRDKQLHSTVSVECNCLHLPLIPASYTTGIKGRDKQLHSTVTVECNCLHLPLIPASYTTGIKGRDKQLHSTVTVECNCLHMPLIPASYTTGIKGRDKQLHSTGIVRCNCLHLPLITASNNSVGCNDMYMYLPLMPASGTTLLDFLCMLHSVGLPDCCLGTWLLMTGIMSWSFHPGMMEDHTGATISSAMVTSKHFTSPLLGGGGPTVTPHKGDSNAGFDFFVAFSLIQHLRNIGVTGDFRNVTNVTVISSASPYMYHGFLNNNSYLCDIQNEQWLRRESITSSKFRLKLPIYNYTITIYLKHCVNNIYIYKTSH